MPPSDVGAGAASDVVAATLTCHCRLGRRRRVAASRIIDVVVTGQMSLKLEPPTFEKVGVARRIAGVGQGL
jgi:hypothetical protein